MFTPDLDLKVTTRCSKFSVLDKTGVDTGDGTKWSGVAGIDPTDIDLAVIRVISPTDVITDHNVLIQIPTIVTGEWWYSPFDGTTEDGQHTLEYRLNWGAPIVSSLYEDYDNVVAGTTKITTETHAMSTGMYVTIANSLNYNGEHYVTVINATSFYINVPFVGDDGVTDAQRMFISTFYPYVYCNSEAGIDKMFANLSRMVKGKARDDYQAQARTAYGLLIALKSSISSANTAALTALLAEITQILSFYDVDPNL